MNYLRKIVLTVLGIAFLAALYVSTGYAQPGRARWSGNNGRHYGWTQGRHRGWDNGRRRGWNDDRYGWLSWEERRRLQRQRYGIFNTRNRYYNDGYLSNRERRRLAERYNRYRRNAYRDRRDW